MINLHISISKIQKKSTMSEYQFSNQKIFSDITLSAGNTGVLLLFPK